MRQAFCRLFYSTWRTQSRLCSSQAVFQITKNALGELVFAEACAVERQKLRGHWQRRASKGQESNCGHRPSGPIRKHLRPSSRLLKIQTEPRMSTEPSTLTKMRASMDSNRLTGNLSPLESALTKTGEGGGGRASDERPRAGQVRAPRYTLAGTLTAANSFSSASPLRNHGRSYRCMYRGSVRFLASSFSAHSRASSRRPASFRKFA